jgi:hypothetical protein
MQRFTESYLELLLKLLPPVAESLGKALGVAPYAIQTFTEAEIRANVVFQVRLEHNQCYRFVRRDVFPNYGAAS